MIWLCHNFAHTCRNSSAMAQGAKFWPTCDIIFHMRRTRIIIKFQLWTHKSFVKCILNIWHIAWSAREIHCSDWDPNLDWNGIYICYDLTHGGRSKMTAILQMLLSNAASEQTGLCFDFNGTDVCSWGSNWHKSTSQSTYVHLVAWAQHTIRHYLKLVQTQITYVSLGPWNVLNLQEQHRI